MKQTKKRYITRNEIDKKEYKDKHKFSQKELRAAVSKPSYILKEIKRRTYFSQTKEIF